MLHFEMIRLATLFVDNLYVPTFLRASEDLDLFETSMQWRAQMSMKQRFNNMHCVYECTERAAAAVGVWETYQVPGRLVFIDPFEKMNKDFATPDSCCGRGDRLWKPALNPEHIAWELWR